MVLSDPSTLVVDLRERTQLLDAGLESLPWEHRRADAPRPVIDLD